MYKIKVDGPGFYNAEPHSLYRYYTGKNEYKTELAAYKDALKICPHITMLGLTSYEFRVKVVRIVDNKEE